MPLRPAGCGKSPHDAAQPSHAGAGATDGAAGQHPSTGEQFISSRHPAGCTPPCCAGGNTILGCHQTDQAKPMPCDVWLQASAVHTVVATVWRGQALQVDTEVVRLRSQCYSALPAATTTGASRPAPRPAPAAPRAPSASHRPPSGESQTRRGGSVGGRPGCRVGGAPGAAQAAERRHVVGSLICD